MPAPLGLWIHELLADVKTRNLAAQKASNVHVLLNFYFTQPLIAFVIRKHSRLRFKISVETVT